MFFAEGDPIIPIVSPGFSPEIPVQNMVSIRGRLFAYHAESSIAL